MEWEIKLKRGFKVNKPVFIEGLPGIGNVGKIAADYIIDCKKAKKVGSFVSTNLAHSVFVTENNCVKIPEISLYHFKNKKDFIILAGDIQPSNEEAVYLFCNKTLSLLKEWETSEIVTLGGIGLPHIPPKPKIYCTGASKKFVRDFVKGHKLETNLYGIVGPIMGVTGLLLGMSKEYKIPSVTLLAETFGHPMYYGIHGARQIINFLSKKYGFKVDTKKLEKEIKTMTEQAEYVAESSGKAEENVSYIG
ncbi:PAC2 family protein [Candidatus Woesearchaeota archaeon]|nr:PAC2 family protein [Candidatus Woesearchaeota archaeon]